jgi:chitin disaccharide deacetylase
LKYLIINADDFGYTRGVNRGVLEAHERGLLTSAGLMVNTGATAEAVEMAGNMPGLSLGLHVNFTNEAQRLFDIDDAAACRVELLRQFDRFVELVGRIPSHLDSHQHVHRDTRRLPHFRELAEEHGIPLRENGPVVYLGGFYGQWEYGVSSPDKVGFEAIEQIVRLEVGHGVTELACHPGYVDLDVDLVYHSEREIEVATLCDARLPRLLDEEGVRLISYHQLPEALGRRIDG